MSKNDSPAGSTGGPVTVPDLPEKLRVHALAKLLGRTSREIIAALAELGTETKSAQSSIDRTTAELVVSALAGPQDAADAPTPAAEPPAAVPHPPGPTAAATDAPAADAPAVDAEQARPSRPARRTRSSRRSAGAPGPVQPDAGTAAAARTEPTDGGAPAAGSAPAAGTAPVVETAPAVEVGEPAAAADAAAEDTAALAPVFAPPAPLFQPPARPSRSRKRAEPSPAPAAPEEPPAEEAAAPPAEAEEQVAAADDRPDTDTDDDASARRRRRRGRRGRGRGRGGDEAEDTDETEGGESDETDDAEATEGSDAESEDGDDETGEQDDSGGSRRRRRRRRRKGTGDDSDGTDDPPNTVTKVRAPRERSDDDGDGVQGVRGSTRLEAKRQRRRDGRDAGRRRVPILSEAEFLARRESVQRSMVVRERGDRVEIAVLEDEVLVEHFVAGGGHDGGGHSLVGNIYLGRVQNVLPSMEAAFVDIGRGRNAVLYAGEVDWDAAGLGGKARRIEQALSSGDSVLVQVTKDPIGHKGARLTTQISLAGRFLVYVPSGGAAGISRKLPDVERKRLKDMLKEIVPSEAGVIIRTASEGVSQEALERDVRRLQAQWEIVKDKSDKSGSAKTKAPTLLYEEPDLLIKVVRDQFNEDFARLVVEGDNAWETLQNYVGHVAPELGDRLHRHVGSTDVFAEYRIDEQLMKALDRKVWLPSGGTLVIDRTEAMTVVDVNTGKFTGSGGNLEETVTRNNLEAAEEIVRQLRLRDIGGIIVIDFIDMVLEANRDLVLRRLTECLARDRTRHQVAEVTSLGLVQMTRKRVGGGLLEHFSMPCEHCRGRGVIVDTEPAGGTGRSQGDGGRKSRGGRGRGKGETEERNGRGAAASAAVAAVAAATSGSGKNNTTAEAAGADAATPAADRGGSSPAAAETAQPAAAETAQPAVIETAQPASTETSPEAAGDTSPPDAAEPPQSSSVAAEPAPAARPEPRSTPEPSANGTAAQTPSAQTPSAQTPKNGRSRKRGRVTRSAGAPDLEAPVVAVVTVPTQPTPPVEAPEVPPQPEPTPVSRPRRSRRAASRPAGPPAADPE